MSAYFTEDQHLEQLHHWWQKHGASVLIIFFLTLIMSLAWHFWAKHQEDKLARASTHYEELLIALVNNDNQSAEKEANLLQANYIHTPYAAIAALVLARNDVYQNHYDIAKNHLSWVMKHASMSSLREVARLRLARILLELQQPAEALKVLEKSDDKAYNVVADEIKGDSYVALNKIEDARNSYKQALATLPSYALLRPILTMKLDNLASSTHTQEGTS